LHGDNFSQITDDTTKTKYTLDNPARSDASLDVVLEPEQHQDTAITPTSLIPAIALANGTVLAAEQTCRRVLIDYHHGWWAIYLHMENIQVKSGQQVSVNTNIGYPTLNVNPACGDHTTAPHVHFAFLNKVSDTEGTYVSMVGRVLCGHEVLPSGLLKGLSNPFVVPNCTSPDFFGRNLWITGHDADFHCTLADTHDAFSYVDNQCHYFQVAVNFVRSGPFINLPLLVLDHGHEVETAIQKAFGDTAAPTLIRKDPRTEFNKSVKLVDSKGKPLFSAIIVASDVTCGGCDNNDDFLITPDSKAINKQADEIKKFYHAGGGILAFAGANNSDVFYNFLPLQATGTTVTEPFKLTFIGQMLGLLGGAGAGSDINCCPTHNSFLKPDFFSRYQIAELDNVGLPETMVVHGGGVCLAVCRP